MTTPTKLEVLAKMASLVRSEEYTDQLSPARRRTQKNLADGIVAAFAETGVPVTVDTLVACVVGVRLQAEAAKASPVQGLLAAITGETEDINPALAVSLALVAADVLDGQVEL